MDGVSPPGEELGQCPQAGQGGRFVVLWRGVRGRGQAQREVLDLFGRRLPARLDVPRNIFTVGFHSWGFCSQSDGRSVKGEGKSKGYVVGAKIEMTLPPKSGVLEPCSKYDQGVKKCQESKRVRSTRWNTNWRVISRWRQIAVLRRLARGIECQLAGASTDSLSRSVAVCSYRQHRRLGTAHQAQGRSGLMQPYTIGVFELHRTPSPT